MVSSSKKIDDEAARWAVRLSAGPLDEREQAQLDAWVQTSPQHEGALIRARATWAYLDRYAALAGGRLSVSRVVRRPVRRWFLAASLLLVALGGTAAWYIQHGRAQMYSSDLGQPRPVALADGSQMLLDASSQAAVRFDRSLREVRLVRGEAMFQVAKDPTRPFVVHAGDLTVKAVGTAFTVRSDAGRVDVLVTEGVVEVAGGSAAPEAAPRRVVANEQLISGGTGVAVQTLDRKMIDQRLAWRVGMLAFHGEPLSAAVEEINRHNRRQIVIEDPELGARPVIGVFRATDVKTFVSATEAAFDVQATEEGDVIRIQTRHASQ